MVERRASLRRPDVKLKVEVLGEAWKYTCSSDVIGSYIQRVRAKLEAALPDEPSITDGPYARLSGFAELQSLASTAAFGKRPEGRTKDQYLAQIDDWAEQCHAAVADGVLDRAVASLFKPVKIRVSNNSKVFLSEVKLRIHIEGDVDGIEPDGSDSRSSLAKLLPKPPREWGPTDPYDYLRHAAVSSSYLANLTPRADGPGYGRVRFRNGGSVEATIMFESIHGEDEVVSDDDDLIFIVRDHSIDSLHGTWRITARDHHEVYSGEFRIAIHPAVDISRSI